MPSPLITSILRACHPVSPLTTPLEVTQRKSACRRGSLRGKCANTRGVPYPFKACGLGIDVVAVSTYLKMTKGNEFGFLPQTLPAGRLTSRGDLCPKSLSSRLLHLVQPQESCRPAQQLLNWCVFLRDLDWLVSDRHWTG